ncbi:DUF4190 domain-containing protein [Microbacterium sp. LjRoot45]|uniref:DUF4190 domain-containing protein n=1 Tax=Microbacterium sp. LjRoot45 TaxID=3342329 RepID=UPI003ED10AE5
MTDPQNPQQPPAYETPAYPAAPPAAPAYNAGGPAVAPAGPVPGKTMGIIAFVLSFFFQLLALILGIVALVQSRKAGRSNGFALAAIIISVVLMIVGAILFFAFLLPTFSAAATCAADPSAVVTLWGVEVPCSQVTTDY